MSAIEGIKSKNHRTLRQVLVASFCLIAVAAIAFYVYSLRCPCEGTPGGILFGERVETAVSDWSMVNDVDICQLQIGAGIRPHSINLNCWASQDGELFVGCMSCESKYWGYQVDPNERGFIRIAGRVYPVTLNRVKNIDEMNRVWRSRFYKLNMRSEEPVPEVPRAAGWWTFSVISRST